jgi:hypothetical protein
MKHEIRNTKFGVFQFWSFNICLGFRASDLEFLRPQCFDFAPSRGLSEATHSACADSVFFLLHAQAPFSVFAFRLIAIRACLAETVEVAFITLFPVNYRRDDIQETRPAKRGADIV